jgi:hypothetical protein
MHSGIDYVDLILMGMAMLVLFWVIAMAGYAAVAATLREPRHRPRWHRQPKHA